MALRLIEMVLPEGDEEAAKVLLKDAPIMHFWHERGEEDRILIKFLIPAEATETVLDTVEKRFATKDGFRIVILPVEASIPRPAPVQESSLGQKIPTEQDVETQGERIHREEVYADITDVTKLSRVYVIMVALFSIVAAIGIVHNNVAIIIGAMVIAPLLGPNVALSFATTLGDLSLGRKALRASGVGVLVTFIISVVLGIILSFDVHIPEIISRTRVSLGDIAISLASGTAGALAFTSGVSSTLIGVMVAVALLPPLVTSGLLMGAGQNIMAMGAMLLFVTNIICINLAGVVTFLVQGIRPLTWWETTRAKKATRRAIILWVLLLSALVAAIHFSQRS